MISSSRSATRWATTREFSHEHHHDAGDDLPAAVAGHRSLANHGGESDVSEVLEIDGSALLGRADHELDVVVAHERLTLPDPVPQIHVDRVHDSPPERRDVGVARLVGRNDARCGHHLLELPFLRRSGLDADVGLCLPGHFDDTLGLVPVELVRFPRLPPSRIGCCTDKNSSRAAGSPWIASKLSVSRENIGLGSFRACSNSPAAAASRSRPEERSGLRSRRISRAFSRVSSSDRTSAIGS